MLEWLRVLSDQVDNLLIVISALPVFEDNLSELETFRKRIMARIELLSLTKEETRDLIRKRVESVGGGFPGIFDENTINFIYERTGGFPREVIRLCNELVNKALEEGREKRGFKRWMSESEYLYNEMMKYHKEHPEISN